MVFGTGCRELMSVTDSLHFFGQINSHRAPGDASPTADTPVNFKLIPPRTQLVPQPVAIATPDGISSGTAHGVSELMRKARLPMTGTCNLDIG